MKLSSRYVHINLTLRNLRLTFVCNSHQSREFQLTPSLYILGAIGREENSKSAFGANFERASLPSTTKGDASAMLHVVIVGGGPTGVEFGAELYDFINEVCVVGNFGL